jgi:hypothetical protein
MTCARSAIIINSHRNRVPRMIQRAIKLVVLGGLVALTGLLLGLAVLEASRAYMYVELVYLAWTGAAVTSLVTLALAYVLKYRRMTIFAAVMSWVIVVGLIIVPVGQSIFTSNST